MESTAANVRNPLLEQKSSTFCITQGQVSNLGTQVLKPTEADRKTEALANLILADRPCLAA